MDWGRWWPFLLLLAAGLVYYFFFRTPAYEKYYQKGIQLYSVGQYEKASVEFLKAISEGQEEDVPGATQRVADAYLMAGEIFDLRLGRFNRAVEVYEEFAKDYPTQPKVITARIRQAEIYLEKLNDPRQTVNIYENLIQQWPRNPEVVPLKRKILETYMNMHEFDQAVVEGKTFLEQAEDKRGDVAIRQIVADSLAYLERWDDALLEYKRVVNDFPDSYYAKLAHFEMGNCLVRLNRLEEAMRTYEQALTSYPNPDVVRQRIQKLEQRIKQENKPMKIEWENLPLPIPAATVEESSPELPPKDVKKGKRKRAKR